MTGGLEHPARQSSIPSDVLRAAESVVGRIMGVDQLGGMSGAAVFRITGAVGTVVVKWTRSWGEVFLYNRLASTVAEAGIRIPRCHQTTAVGDGDHWLVLEDIPEPLPVTRRLADPEVMAVLARLHELPVAEFDGIAGGFVPSWYEATNQTVASRLDEVDLTRLASLRAEFGELAAPVGVISGDPNPLNRGIAADGQLTLMDWDRLGTGHPAIDVAITVPGLGTRADFARAAWTYAHARREVGLSGGGVTARQLVVVKSWTAAQLIAEAPAPGSVGARDSPAGSLMEVAGALSSALPGCLREVG